MNNYEPTVQITSMIEGLFASHPPHGDQAERYKAMREKFLEMAGFVARNTPASAEQTLAIRWLHIASMQANAAIAVNEDK